MYLSDLRELAQRHGLREASCRFCPPEDWAPSCDACDGVRRIWVAEGRLLSDQQLGLLQSIHTDRAA